MEEQLSYLAKDYDNGIMSLTDVESRSKELKKQIKELKLRELQKIHVGMRGEPLKLPEYKDYKKMWKVKAKDGKEIWGKSEEIIIDKLLAYYGILLRDTSFNSIWEQAEAYYCSLFPDKTSTHVEHLRIYEKYFDSEIRKKDIKDFDGDYIYKYLLKLAQSKRFRKQEYYDIKSIFNFTFDFAQKEKYVFMNPAKFDKIRNRSIISYTNQSVKNRRSSQLLFDEDEFSRLSTEIIRVDKKNQNKCYPLMAEFQELTGVRPGELVAIKKNSIDGDYIWIEGFQRITKKPRQQIYVPFTKNEKGETDGGRKISMSKRLKEIIDEAISLQTKDSEYIFTNSEGEWCNREGYSKWFRTKCQKAKVKSKYGTYALRRRANSNFEKWGFTPSERAEILGHSPATNLNNYTGASPDLNSRLNKAYDEHVTPWSH